MEIITNIIIEYLKYNKRLCVPKLGTFIVKQSSGSIIFSDLMRGDDGMLRSLLMANGMRELEANGAIDRFVFEIRHAITVDGAVKIEGFGEFTANVNNTITVTPQPLKRVFGGNIKPPVEIIQKRIPPKQEARPKPQTTRTITAKRSQENTEEGLTLGKPDAYLRGLKYDSNKNKKREESGHGKRVHGGVKGWIILLLLLVIAGGTAYILWPHNKSVTTPPQQSIEAVVECDTTLIDSLLIDSLNIANMAEGTLPNTTITATPTEIINE